jgi:NhaP-type Na+/H+ or K+/H+ antiporter
LAKNPIIEILIILIFGYFSYIVSELRGNSGIISLLVCALIMA